MIIVETKWGSSLINDKEVLFIQHIKGQELVRVYVRDKNGDAFAVTDVNDVIQVTYTSDTQAVKWKQNGTEFEKLLDKNEEIIAYNTQVRTAYYNLLDKYDLMPGDENEPKKE